MKQNMKASFGRRWFVGSVAVMSAAGPILGAVYLSRWVDSHFPDHGWLSFVGWLLAVLSLICWPAIVPDLLRSILQNDAGLEERPEDKKSKSVVTHDAA